DGVGGAVGDLDETVLDVLIEGAIEARVDERVEAEGALRVGAAAAVIVVVVEGDGSGDADDVAGGGTARNQYAARVVVIGKLIRGGRAAHDRQGSLQRSQVGPAEPGVGRDQIGGRRAGAGGRRRRRTERDRVVERFLLQIGQQQIRPVPRRRIVLLIDDGGGAARRGRILDRLLPAARRQGLVGVVIIVQG